MKHLIIMKQTINSLTIKFIVLLMGVCFLSPSIVAAQLVPDWAANQMLSSSKVGTDLVDKLKTNGKAYVVIAFDVPDVQARGGYKVFNTPANQAALDLVTSNILKSLPQNDFSLKHRYININGIAGEINYQGVLKLLRNPNILRVDLDVGGMGSMLEAMPLVSLDTVQSKGYTGAGIMVAVLDSGIDSDHPDLQDNHDPNNEACFCVGSGGANCCPGGLSTGFGPGSAEDDHGHGTNVTGIITSQGTVANLGGAPDADILAIKVLDSNNVFWSTSNIVAALDWIIANRPDVDIINMSLGTSALFDGDCDNATAWIIVFATAINTLWDNGVPVFASAGNDVQNLMEVPACIANTISIGAVWDSDEGYQSFGVCTDPTTQADQATCFTNVSGTTDLFAPGAYTTSTGLGGGSSTYAGTSQASPISAACAATLKQKDPNLIASQIDYVMSTYGDPTYIVWMGYDFPRVNCDASLYVLPCQCSSGACCDGCSYTAGCDSDGDTIPDYHEFFGNTDVDLWDAMCGPSLFCYGDQDGNGVTALAEVVAARDATSLLPVDYSQVYPSNGETIDLNGDTIITLTDVVALRDWTALGSNADAATAVPATVNILSPPGGTTVFVGETVEVVVEVRGSGGMVRPGVGIIFEVLSGSATFIGGRGDASLKIDPDTGTNYPAGSRWAVTSETAGGATAKMIVRREASGVIQLRTRVPKSPSKQVPSSITDTITLN